MTRVRVCVIGSGLMGQGIAQLFAAHGHDVALYDIAATALERARIAIADICSFMQSTPDTLSRVTYHTELAPAVSGAGLVIEAAAEKVEIKQSIFAELERLAASKAILASNTSVIPITQIARPISDRSRVMGMHFWNPPYLVPLVEVVKIEETSHQASEQAVELINAVGQAPVIVQRDIPGFIGNRLQHAMKREAIALVAAGVCDAATVDQVIKQGFGARLAILGTLEQSDMVGLNLTLDIHNVLIPDLDVTPGAHPYLEKLVAEGNLGMKTGRGFYEWTDERAQAVRDRLRTFLAAQAEHHRKSKQNNADSSGVEI